MRDRLIRMMYGRNGVDELSRFLTIAACVLLFIGLFIQNILCMIFWLPGLALLVWAYVRIFSRNLYRRRAENARYINIRYRIMNPLRQRWQRFRMRKEYRYFKCPGCKVMIRIPRGRGEVVVTCPKCRRSFQGKS